MIKLNSYTDRLELIEVEFRFVRHAIASLSAKKKHSFFSDLSREQTARIEANLKLLTPDVMSPEAVQDLSEYAHRTTRNKFPPRNRGPYTETIQDGTNASELLIRVALFESFMKDIHAEVLRAKPSLLAKIRPEREVKYQHIFTDKPTFDAILHQQILREVEEVDRLSFQKRADYFARQLNLPLADEHTLAFVAEMMKARNEISHENPLKTVSPADLARAIEVLRQIPTCVCAKAATEYGKSHFA
jgi:hypothetical protein